MTKKLWLSLLGVFLGLVVLFAFITHTFSNMILFPSWYHIGLNQNCNSLVRDSSPELCIENPESIIKQPFEKFELDSQFGMVSGWFFPSSVNNKSAVVFVHGAGSDRREGFKYVSFLNREGYSVYLFDAANHGKSANNGKGVSFGYRETESFRVVFNLAQSRFEKLFVITNSMGISAVSLAKSTWEKNLSGLVIENPPFSLVRLIKENRIAQALPDWFLDFTIRYTALRGEFNPYVIEPGEIARTFPIIPIFLCHGSLDDTVPLQHGKDFYNNLASDFRFFFEAKNAGHGRVWNQYPAEYQEFVLKVLKEGLKNH
jgi:pimeloyl-ACP methyl ester carboxylesterase